MKRIIIIACVFILLFCATVFSGCHIFCEECNFEGLFCGCYDCDLLGCGVGVCECYWGDCEDLTDEGIDWDNVNFRGKDSPDRILSADDYEIENIYCKVEKESMVFFNTYKLHINCAIVPKVDIAYCTVRISAMKDDFVITTVERYFEDYHEGYTIIVNAEYELRKVYGEDEIQAVVEIIGEVA